VGGRQGAEVSEVSCIVIDHLDRTELRALSIALNRLGETGAWDPDALRLEFEELTVLGVDLVETGFETAEIDGLNGQIGAVEARIARLQTSLRSLHRQVNLSDISLTINAAMVPGHPVSSGGGFTLGKAAHDAGRVLVVAAGVALVALAVLVPLGIVIALALWIAHAVRQRRREQALDLV